MKVENIINNNVVSSRDLHGNEIILMGRGIGFHAKDNKEVDLDKIQKTFILNDENNIALQTILQTPIEYIELVEDIVTYAQNNLKKKIPDSLYIALVDHISTAIERYRENKEVKNILLWEVKQFYKEDFSIGMYAISEIEKRYKIKMLEDEAAFIAIYFVTAQLEGSISTIYKVTTFINEIVIFIENYFNIKLNDDSSAYLRFTTHLKYFGQRLFSDIKIKESNDYEMFEFIKKRYEKAYACTDELSKEIYNHYNYKLSNDEKLFLTIHITKLTQDLIRK